jgi:hypothetical protein
MRYKVAPLPGSMMVMSIIGFILSYNIFKSYPSWGFAFMIVFAIMFISTIISMTYAPIENFNFKKENIK